MDKDRCRSHLQSPVAFATQIYLKARLTLGVAVGQFICGRVGGIEQDSSVSRIKAVASKASSSAGSRYLNRSLDVEDSLEGWVTVKGNAGTVYAEAWSWRVAVGLGDCETEGSSLLVHGSARGSDPRSELSQ